MTFSIPWASLLGGMLLGISATLLLLMNGKIAGISGILSGLLKPERGDFSWRMLFAAGVVAGGVLGALTLSDNLVIDYPPNGGLLAAVGLLVGLGTRLGNGCTSGHGICGIGRLSRRSLVATAVFMLVAVLTVFVRLHLI
ncbi:YeeE/YedE family protein [Vibrio sp. ABG19]|uniref:YeeE/YedE family protein n=1 Tax=Vibrio sp. ABG19 TaxID=2817385 RepID=UPI00249DB844|nr:YeeE/YedE family protein [Vibrio sp. ABG19]WGY45124.1 YeeE/YedE family protein [Vibrio sp. ABG19]